MNIAEVWFAPPPLSSALTSRGCSTSPRFLFSSPCTRLRLSDLSHLSLDFYLAEMPITAAEIEAYGALTLEQVAPFPEPEAGDWYTEAQVLDTAAFLDQVCACWQASIHAYEREREGPQVLSSPGDLLAYDISSVRVVASGLVHARFGAPPGRGFATEAKQKDWVSFDSDDSETPSLVFGPASRPRTDGVSPRIAERQSHRQKRSQEVPFRDCECLLSCAAATRMS